VNRLGMSPGKGHKYHKSGSGKKARKLNKGRKKKWRNSHHPQVSIHGLAAFYTPNRRGKKEKGGCLYREV